ncbi:hypothetical protein SAMN05216428_104192 [Nitrosospira sp. Nsp11]|nr:hypothetical protein SAMN05216428_104192 [Nitrosospira sp. Nsp11]
MRAGSVTLAGIDGGAGVTVPFREGKIMTHLMTRLKRAL